MVRKAWVLGVTLLLAMGAVSVSAAPKGEIPAYLKALDNGTVKAHIVGENARIPMRDAIGLEPIDRNVNNPNVHRDIAYGDSMIIGYTWYDYQANGTIGKQIAKDREGGVHFTYMKGYAEDPASQRKVAYNYLKPDGELISVPEEAAIVDISEAQPQRAGYTCMTLLPEDHRALVFFHVLAPPAHANDYIGTALGVDFLLGYGAFSQYYPNPFPGISMIWPKGAAGLDNTVHMLATESPPAGGAQDWQRVGYWRGTPANSYEVWDFNDPCINVDTAGTISSNVAASVTSNRVAMAWFHNRIGADQGPWADFGGLWQRNNDIRYIISDENGDFNFEDSVKSLTKIVPPNLAIGAFDLTEAYGDTFRPYCDIDIQFDPWGDDNLYAVFPVQGFFEEPYADYAEDGDDDVCDNISTILNYHNGGESILWFWNQELDTLTMVANGWYPSLSWTGAGWGSRLGAWRMNTDRGSIAFNPNEPGTIYVTWVSFPQIMDYNPEFDWSRGFDEQEAQPMLYFGQVRDTSATGFKGAEVMVSISTDYGITWREPINVTNTFWDGDQAPRAGEMASEAWQSVAYLADDTLHIAYVQDLDAGGVIQTPPEGEATNSPFVYQRIAISDLPLNDPVELPREDFQFHNYADFIPQVTMLPRSVGVPTPGTPVDVTARVFGAGGVEIRDASLVYRLNGGDPSSVAMQEVAADTFSARIPAQANGTVVWYRVYGTNVDGEIGYGPKGNSWMGYVVRGEGELTIRDVQYRPEYEVVGEDTLAWNDDYSFYKGYEVTLSGVITTPGDFNANYGGFAMQDQAARWSGIIVRGNAGNVNIGDAVTVTGTVMERDPNDRNKWEYATYIQATNVQVTGQAEFIPPLHIANMNELTFAGGCESLEGVLVDLGGFSIGPLTGDQGEDRTYWPITNDGATYGWISTIGLTLDEAYDLHIFDWVEGTTVDFISGIFTENNGYYAIVPRGLDEFGSAGVDPSVDPNPTLFTLDPVYPNPFNPVTTVGFNMPKAGWGTLALYDMQGRLVVNVAEGQYEAGAHSFILDASALSTGVYVLKLEALNQTATQKVVLMK